MKINISKLNDITTPTPYLAIDLNKVRSNYNKLKKLLPDFTVYYAMKSNPEPEILAALKKEGCQFEIASIGELDRLEKQGVNPKDVIFSNPVKIPSHIKQAFDRGVRYFAFDSVEEAEKIAENAPGAYVYARVSVSNHGSIINLSNKFGVDPAHVVPLMGVAKDYGLIPWGVSFHVGSQSENVHLWDEAIELMSELIKRLESADITIESVNIGGGIPIKYDAPVPDMEDIAVRVAKNVKKYLPPHIKLMCEPGRALVGDAGVIATTIISRAIRKNESWLYLDTGRFQSFIEMFESEELRYPVYTSLNLGQDNKIASKSSFTLTGPTCDSYDTIMHQVSLPSILNRGEKLYFGSAGAYTHVYGAPFNDFPVPTVVYANFIEENIDRIQ